MSYPPLRQTPVYANQSFSVTWQSPYLEEVSRHIAADTEPDFSFWHTSPGYDPLGFGCMAYFPGDGPALAEFYPDPAGFASCNVLHIDLLTPQADYFELRYPGASYSYMLDTACIAENQIPKCPDFPERWIAFTTTVRTIVPMSAIRRSMFFPDVQTINATHGSAYEDIIPSCAFPHALERWLNATAETNIQKRYYDHNMPNYQNLAPDEQDFFYG